MIHDSRFWPCALATLAVTACATPTVTNHTPSTAMRNPEGSYTFSATVDPNGTRIEDVRAIVEDAPWPMTAADDEPHRALVFPSPCARTLSYEYEVEYRRKKLLGSGYESRTRTLQSPSVGGHTLEIEGEPPEGCPETWAGIYHVDTTTDAVDADPRDGLCATVAGACSLRAAIMQANATEGHDIIHVPAGTYALTLTGTETVDVPDPAHGDLDITDAVSLHGADEDTVIIEGGTQRIFDVHMATGEGFVRFSRITLRDGAPASGPGGAIFNRGEAQVHRVRFEDNRLSSSATCAAYTAQRICNRGGAIFNEGRMRVQQSTFTHNRTCGSTTCTGISGQGGAISNFGQQAYLEIDGSTFDDNSARFVGAVMNREGTVEIVNSTFHENKGAWASTLWTSAGNIRVTHTTMVAQSDQPFVRVASGRVLLVGSIVFNQSFIGVPYCSGDIVSGGFNHIGGPGTTADYVGTCTLTSNDVTGRFVLGALDDNGGPTPTISIRPVPSGSTATELVDGASNSSVCPATDQRGYLRPRDGDDDGTAVCDPGAFEAL